MNKNKPTMPTPSAISNRINELVSINYLFSARSIVHMGIRGAFFTLFFVSLLAQCDRPKSINTSLFSVVIDVMDSLDQNRNRQGFEFLLYSQKTQNSPVDTLFIGETDSMGRIMSTISFNEAGAYPLQISRDGSPILNMRILLAPDDSVLFTGEFPEIGQTLKVNSREQRAVDVFDRIDAGFTRARRFIAIGALADTAIADELRKWANLYKQVYNDYPGTFASSFALEAAVLILSDIDQQKMMSLINEGLENKQSLGLAITVGKDYMSKINGFDQGVKYLDSLKSIVSDKKQSRVIDQMLVELYYDSLRIEQGKESIARFKRLYEDDEYLSFWYKNMRFEFEYLTPGTFIPAFSFVSTEGETINEESIKGAPTLLEFTLMENGLYQQQYEELMISYQLFSPRGFQIYTMAFDESITTIWAFFEERDRFWSIAEPSMMNRKSLVKTFNIQYYPTRILLDAEGRIIRKFVGDELDDFIPYLIPHLNSN
tara:strand:+ start:7264 stop:8721 length:1458 start_codon:yes stop_codon:yes gene_type:complete